MQGPFTATAYNAITGHRTGPVHGAAIHRHPRPQAGRVPQGERPRRGDRQPVTHFGPPGLAPVPLEIRGAPARKGPLVDAAPEHGARLRQVALPPRHRQVAAVEATAPLPRLLPQDAVVGVQQPVGEAVDEGAGADPDGGPRRGVDGDDNAQRHAHGRPSPPSITVTPAGGRRRSGAPATSPSRGRGCARPSRRTDPRTPPRSTGRRRRATSRSGPPGGPSRPAGPPRRRRRPPPPPGPGRPPGPDRPRRRPTPAATPPTRSRGAWRRTAPRRRRRPGSSTTPRPAAAPRGGTSGS